MNTLDKREIKEAFERILELNMHVDMVEFYKGESILNEKDADILETAQEIAEGILAIRNIARGAKEIVDQVLTNTMSEEDIVLLELQVKLKRMKMKEIKVSKKITILGKKDLSSFFFNDLIKVEEIKKKLEFKDIEDYSIGIKKALQTDINLSGEIPAFFLEKLMEEIEEVEYKVTKNNLLIFELLNDKIEIATVSAKEVTNEINEIAHEVLSKALIYIKDLYEDLEDEQPCLKLKIIKAESELGC